MSENKKHTNLSEKELDNLLNQAFLDLDFTNPKNQELMETISQEVMQPKPTYLQLINKSLFTKILGSLLLVTTVFILYFAFFKTATDKIIQAKHFTEKTILTPEIKQETPKQQNHNTTPLITKETTIENTKPVIENKPEEHKNNLVVAESIDKGKQTTTYFEENKAKLEDTGYVFPKLTEKEIKKNNRQKLIMAGMLVKPNKYWYPLIGDKKIYGNLNDTSAAFYIARSEVSNLEYRTFLLDLIIHNRREDFLKAKPHQEMWLKAPGNVNGKKMKDLYFSDEKYNDYPVVNVTPKGAELYCKWLGSIFKTEDIELHGRLPYENEWLKAAKGENSGQNFPWKNDSIQNKRGCHLANFCIQKNKEDLKKVSYCTPKNPDAYTSAEFMLGDSMMTAKVFSYNPNDNGLYCIIGNVAEMVYTNADKHIITKGGSWNSDINQCKLNSSEELNGVIKANAMTGFRPLLRYTYKKRFGSLELEDLKTGLTTLNQDEIKTYQKEKQKMIEALIRIDKSSYALIPTGTCVYKGEAVSIASFYMQTTEVTNLQYRTFLADLLIQNRQADYLIAKPDQYMWTKKFPWSYVEPMKMNYFWHPAYDEYPVVNISRDAAEMYCKWLTIETNKVLKEKSKPLINDVRIPADVEWAYAANNGKNQARYANGIESLKDSKGKYTVNYNCYYLNECKYDSAQKLYLPQSAKKPLDKESQERALISDGHFHMAPVKSYTPNSYGLYCMGGNVAEMVWNFDTKNNKPIGKGTKGGSWFSADEFLQINADEEYPNELNASPLIGFRPVITEIKKK